MSIASQPYELRDSQYPGPGQRFGGPTGLDRARKALAASVPPGRFVLIDRRTNTEVPPHENEVRTA